jgi:hypothetical protein
VGFSEEAERAFQEIHIEVGSWVGDVIEEIKNRTLRQPEEETKGEKGRGREKRKMKKNTKLSNIYLCIFLN